MSSKIALGRLVILLGCAASGCASQNQTTLNLENAAIGGYILGVQPEGTLLNVYPGKIENGVYDSTFFDLSNFTGEVHGGYLVRTAKAGKRFALIRIRVSGKLYIPCEDTKAATFEVDGGTLIYLGDLRFEQVGTELEYTVDYDLESAQRYVRAQHPEFSGEIVRGKLEFYPTNQSCVIMEHVNIG